MKENFSICLFGTYRREYNRNQLLVKCLRAAGVNVIECHQSLWRDTEDRIQAASGGWASPNFLWRAFRTYFKLLRDVKHVQSFDLMLCGYPGMLDVFFARYEANKRRVPLVWDVFMSTVVISRERKLDSVSPMTNRLLALIEKRGARLPDQLLLDTPAHIDYLSRSFQLPGDRFWLFPTGADDELYYPHPQVSGKEQLKIIYYGTFIPNHGVPYIIEAARILKSLTDIQFELIGEGPDLDNCMELAQKYALQNIKFVPWLTKNDLIDHLDNADICLGAFGLTAMSKMTVQNKIYEGLAMRKVVITGDSLAIRQMLEPGKHLLVCDRTDPATLADTIISIKDDEGVRDQIAEGGYQYFLANYSMKVLGKQLAGKLVKLIA